MSRAPDHLHGHKAGPTLGGTHAERLEKGRRRHRLLGQCLAVLFRILARTWRIRWHGDAEQLEATRAGPCIYAFWHGNQLPLLAAYRPVRPVALVSLSRDGTVLDGALQALGYPTIRGSSSLGGREALLDLADALRAGHSVALAVDGPRGPARVPRPGVAALARRTGRPVVPLSASARGMILETWDRFLIPWPFARVHVHRGRPIQPSETGGTSGGEGGAATPDVAPDLLRHLAEALNRLESPHDPSDRGRPGPIWTGDRPAGSGPGMLMTIYRTVTRGLEWIVRPLWLVVRTVAGGFRADSTGRVSVERFGVYRADLLARRPVIWFHAASLGEARVAREVALAVQDRLPDHACVLTVTSGATRRVLALESSEPFALVALAPLDCPGAVARAVQTLSPSAVFVVETELWPNLLDTLNQRAIPWYLVNGRISTRAFARYHRVRGLFAPLLEAAQVLPRSELDAWRFRALGVQSSRCFASVDLKCLGPGVQVGEAPVELKQWGRGPVLVAASTHPGEEELVLRAFRTVREMVPGAKLLLAPRDPTRVEQEETRFVGFPRWSLVKKGKQSLDFDTPVLVWDTLGELRLTFPVATAVAVGGTLVPGVGGHNLFEPAAAGKPVLFGPHLDEVMAQAETLRSAGGGTMVRDPAHLAEACGRLLSNPALARQRGVAARKSVQDAAVRARLELHRFLDATLGSPRSDPGNSEATP